MATSEADIAAQLIERLLGDPAFRSEFRRDPATACRKAGLDELADEMSIGAGKAMMTLDQRESKSSLAGVMMAAAMEGVGIYQFGEHVLPHLDDVPSAVGDVLSRVSLPAIPGRGALSGGPDAPDVAPAAENGANGGGGAARGGGGEGRQGRGGGEGRGGAARAGRREQGGGEDRRGRVAGGQERGGRTGGGGEDQGGREGPPRGQLAARLRGRPPGGGGGRCRRGQAAPRGARRRSAGGCAAGGPGAGPDRSAGGPGAGLELAAGRSDAVRWRGQRGSAERGDARAAREQEHHLRRDRDLGPEGGQDRP